MTEALPDLCGVVGGGRMGAGIAYALLVAGSDVVVVERDDLAAAAAAQRIRRVLRTSREIGEGSQEHHLDRLVVTTDHARLSGAALVVEAVPEVPELKLQSLQAVAAHVEPDAVLATNTSSISIDFLAESVPQPERVIGLHFFNPVPSSRLVEVVVGARTAPELVGRADQWVRQLLKTPVTVRSTPGFATSRLGVAIGLEAIRALEDGVASAESLDTAMVLGYGLPIGPLRLTDIVGLDVRLGIARYLEKELGPRFSPPTMLVEMVERGDLGRKSGQGFYSWPDGR